MYFYYMRRGEFGMCSGYNHGVTRETAHSLAQRDAGTGWYGLARWNLIYYACRPPYRLTGEQRRDESALREVSEN